jgi:hypothetical protein
MSDSMAIGEHQFKSGRALIERCRAMCAPALPKNGLATGLAPGLAPNRPLVLPTDLLAVGISPSMSCLIGLVTSSRMPNSPLRLGIRILARASH